MAALSDVTVLELSTGVAGAYCSRLLRDLGARVVKVEPPGGDPLRQEPPFVGEESAFFAFLNAGKESVEASLDDERLDALAKGSEIIVHSERGDAADALDARLAKANPRAVVLSLTPYGRWGPRASWEATELTEYATSGYHFFGGDPAREPLALPGHQVGFHVGSHAAVGALAALWHVRLGGEGQRIEMSHQEAILNDHTWLTTMWTHTGQVQARVGSTFVPCKDGFIFLFGLAPSQNVLILMERFDLLEDETLLLPLNWQARQPEIRAALAAWAADKTKQEVYHAAQELRIAMTPVNTMADLVNDPQLAAREFFETLEVGGTELLSPGFPYKLTETPCVASRRAPKLGEHNDVALEPVQPTGLPKRETALPLEGLRIIEVTANWAGPQAGRLLADLGADIVKVELQTKPATRGGIFVGGDIWPNSYNRAGYFNKQNRNKRDVCLNLATREGRATFLKLVQQADAVVENNAARVMGQLGVAYETLREANPRIVMCSMAGMGATGPERNYSAYGSNIETSSGLASILGYGPGEYFGTGSFYADPVTGIHGAAGVLAALFHVKRTGKGQWLDMSLLENVVPYFAQPFLQYGISGVVPEPRGNRSPVHAPQGVYRSAGTDCWLALTIRNESDWAKLCATIDRPDLAADPRLTSTEGRRTHHDAIDEAIEAWSRTIDQVSAAERLQANGVPAAPVMPNWQIVSDNHLNDRGYFVAVRHPEAGTHRFPGFPWRLEKTPAQIRMHAPLFAEHNHDIFAGLLGLSEDEIADLYESGATGDEPIYQVPFG